MIAYGIGMLPLIRKLKSEFPAVKQLWYADDALIAAKFHQIQDIFSALEKYGPTFGYFPEPSKSVLVVTEANANKAKTFFRNQGFKVRLGSRYLGGYLGSATSQSSWLEEKVDDWVSAIKELSRIAEKYPQSAYCGLQKSLQLEWQFLQRVCPETSEAFRPVWNAISDGFLQSLFQDNIPSNDYRVSICKLPVKYAGLALPNPTESAASNYENSCLRNSHLIAALRGNENFRHSNHLTTIREANAELKTRQSNHLESQLSEILDTLSPDIRRAILRAKDTGHWLSIFPSIINGTVLSPQEFRDALFLRYARTPPDLPKKCDGCDATFNVAHGLSCKKGGLVIIRHNEIRDELGALCAQALTNSAIRDEPLINTSRTPAEPTSANPTTPSEKQVHDDDRGDLLVRGFWTRGTDVIVDVRVTDTDVATYRSLPPAKVLEKQEREKKKKYLEPCLQARRHFTPFVVSADGLKGREATVFLKRIAALLSEKWQRPYSEVCGYVNARMSIAIVRATHLCLRGSRVPAAQMSNRRPQWEDRAGLGLFRSF
jgi:hypothetical protein